VRERERRVEHLLGHVAGAFLVRAVELGLEGVVTFAHTLSDRAVDPAQTRLLSTHNLSGVARWWGGIYEYRAG